MTAAKQKGTTFETLIVDALGLFVGAVTWGARRRPGRFGIFPRRVAQAGFEDLGDVHGIEPFVGQAKAYKNLADALRLGVAGAVAQARRAGGDYGVAFVKKPRGAIGDAYAVMRLEDFARVLLRLRRAEEILAYAEADSPFDLVGDHEAGNATDLEHPFPTAADIARARREDAA